MSEGKNSENLLRQLYLPGSRRRLSISQSNANHDSTSESRRDASDPEPPKKEIRPDPMFTPVLHPKHCSGQDRDVTRMALFLQEHPESLDAHFPYKNKYGIFKYLTPLTGACKMLHVKCVEFLLDQGARVDVESENRHAIAHAAMASQSARFVPYMERSNQNCEIIIKMIIQKKALHSNLYASDYRAYRDLVCMVANGLNLYNIVKILLESNEINFVSAQNRLYSLNGEPYTSNLLSKISENKNYDIRLMKLFIVHGDSFENKEPIRVKRQNNFCGYTFRTNAFAYQIITSCERAETKIEILKIFHYFGGNLRGYLLTEKSDTCQTLLQCIESMPDNIREQGIARHVEELISNPLSLRQACRLSLWKTLRGKYWRFVMSQGLPRDIVNFLLLETV